MARSHTTIGTKSFEFRSVILLINNNIAHTSVCGQQNKPHRKPIQTDTVGK
jgi:hypothetical protein